MYIISLAQIGCKTLNCDMIIFKPYVKIAWIESKITSKFDIKLV